MSPPPTSKNNSIVAATATAFERMFPEDLKLKDMALGVLSCTTTDDDTPEGYEIWSIESDRDLSHLEYQCTKLKEIVGIKYETIKNMEILVSVNIEHCKKQECRMQEAIKEECEEGGIYQ